MEQPTDWPVPFCHCFETRDRRYVYDVNSNRIVETADELWEAICELADGQNTAQVLRKPPRAAPGGSLTRLQRVHGPTIRSIQERDGLFLASRPSASPPALSVDDLLPALTSGLQSLNLQVTNACNMRCTYCYQAATPRGYAGRDGSQMSWHTARAAVDYFAERADRSQDGFRPGVAFYGGEPLLAYDLVRRVIEYCEQRFAGDFVFPMTTNGTLLGAAQCTFLAEHGVGLVVSVDGPPEVHDRQRRLADGTGSFDTIARNLRTLRAAYPEYYDASVTLSMVVTAMSDVPRIADFLDAWDLLPNRRMPLVVSGNMEGDPKRRLARHLADRAQPQNRLAAEQMAFVDLWRSVDYTSMSAGDYLRSGGNQYFPLLYRLYHRAMQMAPQSSEWRHAGTCIPGVRRCHVMPDGQFYPCHLLPPVPQLVIGSAQSGIDGDAVARLLNRFLALTSANCADCWAVRLCSLCEVRAWRDAGWSAEGMEPLCAAERLQIHDGLVMLAEILEKRPDALQNVPRSGARKQESTSNEPPCPGGCTE